MLVIIPDATIRIIGGNNKLQGRVEIMYQGIWGTMCDDGWDDIDATVVCKELGFLNGTVARQDRFESGSGPVWLHQVGCLGNENKLSHCTHTGAGNVGNCSHAQDAGVQCNPHGNYKCNIISILIYIASNKLWETFGFILWLHINYVFLYVKIKFLKPFQIFSIRMICIF